MIPLTDHENKYYEKKKYCHICKKKFWCDKENKSKYDVYHKVYLSLSLQRKIQGGCS